jgi:hypothetical protein
VRREELVDMKVLVACEESQAVTIELRKLGHEAYSCDLIPCSGGRPEWHLQQDVVPLLKLRWDLIIAFPPCTHLAVSGAAHFEKKRADGRHQQGIDFFMLFADIKNTPRVAIENPVGVMSREWRKPDQIIEPFMFGDDATKKTCIWLKGLPELIKTNVIEPSWCTTSKGTRYTKWWYDTCRISLKDGRRARARSRTFPGIAKAMAEQWAGA